MNVNQSVDNLILRLQRREVVGSRQTAIETTQLLYRYVGAARFSSVEMLIEQIKALGRRLQAANPKELAIGNIIRKILRLMREEYKAAYVAHAQAHGVDVDAGAGGWGGGTGAPLDTPGTPLPPTPGLHAPAGHYLSGEYREEPKGFNFASVGTSAYFPESGGGIASTSSSGGPSSPLRGPDRAAQPPLAGVTAGGDTSLSNFVQMRHTRAQLERAGSSLALSDLEHGVKRLGLDSRTPSERGMMRSRRNSRDGPTAGDAILPARQPSYPGQSRGSSIASPRMPTSPAMASPATAAQESAAQAAQAQQAQQSRDAFQKKSMSVKPVLVDAIREVLDELELTHEACAKGAKEHIHSSEIILTLGMSKTVLAFLKAAWKDRNFTVIVAETSPSNQGHQMAKALAKLNIPTILVPDSSIYALMPRITKVVMGAHSILANGGLFAISGALLTALAAKAHSTPVVVVSGQFKFAPAWNLYHDYASADFLGPGQVLSYDEREYLDKVEVLNPFYDYIRPDLVNLFITNEGDHSPVTAYRIIKDAYDDEDMTL